MTKLERTAKMFAEEAELLERLAQLPKKEDHYRCQFCTKTSPSRLWKKDACPECGRVYDAILAQEGDD